MIKIIAILAFAVVLSACVNAPDGTATIDLSNPVVHTVASCVAGGAGGAGVAALVTLPLLATPLAPIEVGALVGGAAGCGLGVATAK